jgi:hypothetical protein
MKFRGGARAMNACLFVSCHSAEARANKKFNCAMPANACFFYSYHVARALTFRNNETDCDENKPYDQGGYDHEVKALSNDICDSHRGHQYSKKKHYGSEVEVETFRQTIATADCKLVI